MTTADTLTEPLIPIRQAMRLCPRTRMLNPGSVHAWATKGVLAADGARLRLHTERVGKRRFCRLSDLHAFLDAASA